MGTDDTEAFFTATRGILLNRWFASYVEALASLRRDGGYLFPFREQFFITEPGFIAALGVDPADPDWERMGFNWVKRSYKDRRLLLRGARRPAPLGSEAPGADPKEELKVLEALWLDRLRTYGDAGYNVAPA